MRVVPILETERVGRLLHFIDSEAPVTPLVRVNSPVLLFFSYIQVVDMGTCSKATLAYGFILDEAQIVKLLFACRKHDEPEGNFKTGSRQKTLQEGETEEVTTFLETWIQGEDVAPFYFKVVSEETEATGNWEDQTRQLAFCYTGSAVEEAPFYEEDCLLSTEIWGSENCKYLLSG